MYRSRTSGTTSKTAPSVAERRSVMYSAWAQASGVADSVGRPNSR